MLLAAPDLPSCMPLYKSSNLFRPSRVSKPFEAFSPKSLQLACTYNIIAKPSQTLLLFTRNHTSHAYLHSS